MLQNDKERLNEYKIGFFPEFSSTGSEGQEEEETEECIWYNVHHQFSLE